jgi:hypothetical protein
VNVRLYTRDFLDPSGLKRVEFELGSFAELDPEGFSKCRNGELRGLAAVVVPRRCRGAIVGHGSARIELESAAQPSTVPLTLLNGAGKQEPRIFMYGSAAAPGLAPIIIPMEFRHLHSSPYSLQGVAEVPAIAGGKGKLVGISFAIRYARNEGGLRRYFVGRCPARAPAPLRLRVGYILENGEGFKLALHHLCRHPARSEAATSQ